ncbi:MAG: LamG domain-containing protein [Candidatus Bathyarchaeia archaeon]
MLDGVSAISYICLLYFISFFPGYMILFWIRSKVLINLPFFVRLPLTLALGLMTLTTLLFIVGFIIIDGNLPILISLFFITLFICHNLRHGLKNKVAINFKSFDNILPAILFMISLFHFSTAISIFRWPPPGDIFWHGMYVSILHYNRKITFNIAPYDPSLHSAPPISGFTGLHVLSADFSLWTGVFPAEAVFIVGGAVVILIPMLLYVSTNLLTKSRFLSLFAFLSVFLTSSDLEEWIVGYFYNGPYPNLFGFLAVLLFLINLVIISENQTDHPYTMHKRTSLLLIILAIFIIYPPFTAIPISYLLVSTFPRLRTFKRTVVTFREKDRLIIILSLMLALSSILVVLAFFYQNLFSQILHAILYRVRQIYGKEGSFKIRTSIFYDSIIGIAVILAGVASIFFIFKRIYINLSIFYMVMFLSIMFSLHPTFYPFFLLILPKRLLMMCSLISWIVLATIINHLSSNLFVNLRLEFTNRTYTLKFHASILVAIIITFLIFTPSLVSNLSFEQANRYSWFTRHGFADDYDVLLWVHKNVKINEVILDDFSFTSYYLHSFSVKNTTSLLWTLSDYKRERAIDALSFLKNPTNVSLFLNLIDKYSIRYVLVTSERGYYIWRDIGGENRYVSKPYTPAQYKSIFNKYPFLKLVFEKGNAGVYKVLPYTLEERNALKFDGTCSYIQVEDSVSLRFTKEFAISIHIKPEQLPAVDTFLVSKRGEYELSWRWNRKLALILNYTIVLESNKVFSYDDIGRWWHIIVVYDGTKAYLYVNGVLDSCSDVNLTIPSNNSPLDIGCRKDLKNNPFGFIPQSIIKEVIIYNHSLSPSEVERLARGNLIKEGLVLYLPLNEGSGALALDRSSYGNNGVIYSATWTNYYVVIVNSIPYDV